MWALAVFLASTSSALRTGTKEGWDYGVVHEIPTGVSTRVGEWYNMQGVCLNADSYQTLSQVRYQENNAAASIPVVPYGEFFGRSFYRTRGTLLVFTVQDGWPFSVGNIWHTSHMVFHTFEALRTLQTAHSPYRWLVENVDAILAWQFDMRDDPNTPGNEHDLYQGHDYYANVIKLLGTRGLQTKLYDHGDLVNHGICASNVLRLAIHKSYSEHLPCWFQGAEPRLALRERALRGLHLAEGPEPRGCRALFVRRSPPQGVNNGDELWEKLRPYLRAAGWDAEVWDTSRWEQEHGHKVSFRDQVTLFHQSSLSIMVHGAENINLVWAPPGAAVVLIVKCGDNGMLTGGNALPMKFGFYTTYPSSCKLKPVQNYSANEGLIYNMDFERDLLPTLTEAMANLEATGVCHTVR